MAVQRIGKWLFDPATGELRRGGDCSRLEPRAARTLELLSEAEGAIVAQERIIAEVWNGRSLSDNSVSTVISQLRRALGDDARKPRLIETVPKRGYRLLGAASAGRPRRGARLLAIAAIAIAALLVGLLFAGRDDRQRLAVFDVANQTGDPAFDPLARATSELLVTQLDGRGYQVVRGAPAKVRLVPTLVMWNGAPSLGLSAIGEGEAVLWSGMTDGDAARVPAGLSAELNEMQAVLPPGGGEGG